MKMSALLMQTLVGASIVSYRNKIPGIIVTSFGFFVVLQVFYWTTRESNNTDAMQYHLFSRIEWSYNNYRKKIEKLLGV